jgi:FlaA1/EpsC-like NDP-sugar epimerase
MLLGLQLNQWGILSGNQWWAAVAAIGISIPIFMHFGLYRAIFRHVGSVAFSAMARVFLIYTGVYFFIFTLVGVDGVPVSMGILQPMMLFILIGVCRYLIRIWLGDIRSSQESKYCKSSVVLIYGAGSAGRQLAAALKHGNQTIVKGFIDDNPQLQGNTINGIPVFLHSDARDKIKKFKVSEVLLAIPSASQSRRNEIISSLKSCGARVRTIPAVSDIASGRIKISDIHDLDLNDLLGRSPVHADIALLEKNIKNNSILVTGAGGSIGGELCRQIIKFLPESLILVDNSEQGLYFIYEELKKSIVDAGGDHHYEFTNKEPHHNAENIILSFRIKVIPCLASVCDEERMRNIFGKYRPDVVFHAAAYKHVPLVEQNPGDGIRNNVFGTLNCALICLETGVRQFTLVSTDKAVRPTNVMGASKRISELILQALADKTSKDGELIRFSMVRFGNVLGSSGSVVPLFSNQIKLGGPVTLTHPDVVRYFMTIPEAAQLVIQASAMAAGGNVFVLDMGEPIRIYDLAVNMIYLSGLMVKSDANPQGDIEIVLTGLRPGEKLYEELLIGNNPQSTSHPKIMMAQECFISWHDLEMELAELKSILDTFDIDQILKKIKKLVPEFTSDRA